MSADNWAICPRCSQRKDVNVATMAAEVEAAYGKVSVQEFDALRLKFEAFRDEPLANTFREDYEIGSWGDGSAGFIARYKGRCTTCDLTYEFKADETIPLGEDS